MEAQTGLRPLSSGKGGQSSVKATLPCPLLIHGFCLHQQPHKISHYLCQDLSKAQVFPRPLCTCLWKSYSGSPGLLGTGEKGAPGCSAGIQEVEKNGQKQCVEEMVQGSSRPVERCALCCLCQTQGSWGFSSPQAPAEVKGSSMG